MTGFKPETPASQPCALTTRPHYHTLASIQKAAMLYQRAIHNNNNNSSTHNNNYNWCHDNNSSKINVALSIKINLTQTTWWRRGEVENSEFSENSETSQNQFPRFSTPSFPFCTIPKMENSEMKTSECSFKPCYQTPSFSNSEFSILHYTQNGKLGVGNLRVFSKVYQNSDFF